ncbi:hypothetical protein [Rufibacter soli]
MPRAVGLGHPHHVGQGGRAPVFGFVQRVLVPHLQRSRARVGGQGGALLPQFPVHAPAQVGAGRVGGAGHRAQAVDAGGRGGHHRRDGKVADRAHHAVHLYPL